MIDSPQLHSKMKTTTVERPPQSPGEIEHRRRLAENDALIRSPGLDNGQAITAGRTAIFTSAIAEWAAEQQQALGFDRPFAVAAIGGTGRGEVTPCSDLDIVFLFEDAIDEAPTRQFLLELQRQTLHTREFRERFGFSFAALPFGFDDVRNLDGKQLNAFLDLDPVHDPVGLTEVFRQQIRNDYDPFEHFLHVRRFSHELREHTGATAERVDQFDLKNDGLRLFLGGIWSLAGQKFVHSHEIYQQLADIRDLQAYHFLLRIRCWIHLRRPPGGAPTAQGNHAEDVMTFDDFVTLGDWLEEGSSDAERLEFAHSVRARLLTARRRIAAFARGVIENELRPGHRISPGNPVALGAGGLYHAEPETCTTGNDRSRAALSLLLIAQRYDLPIDPSELQTTFLRAGDWLEPVPELSRIFSEPRGSLAKTFEFLAQLPGAEDRLFPGYAKFESSIDERVRTEQSTLRGPLARKKLEALDKARREGRRLLEAARDADALADVAYDIQMEVEAALVSQTHLAAIRLAIKTKRLPVTSDDLVTQQDPRRPLADRFSSGFSGVPVEEYYEHSFEGAGFDPKILEVTRFLVENRGTFRKIAEAGIVDDLQVKELLRCCDGDLDRLRALYVFTHADRHSWKSPVKEPTRFFNIRELYAKARMPADKKLNPVLLLRSGGYQDPESLEILKDFGKEFFEGIYRHYAIRFGSYLLRLKAGGRSGKPRVTTIRERSAEILGVVARDDRGIAASISGALWKAGLELSQAHLFSADRHGLAMNFFHLAPPRPGTSGERLAGPELSRLIEGAIVERLHVSAADELALPKVAQHVIFAEWRPGLYRLQAETADEAGVLVYVLCCKAYRRLGADIHGLAAHAGPHGSTASVYLTLPEEMSFDAAKAIVADWA